MPSSFWDLAPVAFWLLAGVVVLFIAKVWIGQAYRLIRGPGPADRMPSPRSGESSPSSEAVFGTFDHETSSFPAPGEFARGGAAAGDAGGSGGGWDGGEGGSAGGA